MGWRPRRGLDYVFQPVSPVAGSVSAGWASCLDQVEAEILCRVYSKFNNGRVCIRSDALKTQGFDFHMAASGFWAPGKFPAGPGGGSWQGIRANTAFQIFKTIITETLPWPR